LIRLLTQAVLTACSELPEVCRTFKAIADGSRRINAIEILQALPAHTFYTWK
jgi:hypothetical protein